MITKETPETLYRATDNREFENREDAEKWDAVVVSHKEMRDAEEQFLEVLSRTWKTKDGLAFRWHRVLYYVWETYHGMGGGEAGVQHVYLIPSKTSLVEPDGWADPEPELRYEDQRPGREPSLSRCKISDLYGRRSAAEAEARRRAWKLVEGLREALLKQDPGLAEAGDA